MGPPNENSLEAVAQTSKYRIAVYGTMHVILVKNDHVTRTLGIRNKKKKGKNQKEKKTLHNKTR